jgi:hypothetical protein
VDSYEEAIKNQFGAAGVAYEHNNIELARREAGVPKGVQFCLILERKYGS